MKEMSPQLQNEFASPCTTIATCWLINRTDGVVMGFTDCSKDLLFETVTYVAATAFTPTAVTTTNDLAVDNLEVTGVLITPLAVISSDGITEGDLEAGIYDYAQIQIFQVNYNDLTQGKVILRAGVLGQVTLNRGQFQAEIRGLTQALQQTIGRLFGPGCDADLGDNRCKVNLTPYTAVQAVTTAVSGNTFIATGLTQPANYFTFGLLTWLTGSNAGLSMEVKNFTFGGTVALSEPMSYAIQVGDTFSVYAGCNKSLDNCKNKFNNVINFQGFPTIPGQDSLLQHAI